LFVYIVQISGTVADFHSLLRTVEGATLVRDLPPDRAVVTLLSDADVPRLATLSGVESLTADRLERPL
jgi:hypothetical protein